MSSLGFVSNLMKRSVRLMYAGMDYGLPPSSSHLAFSEQLYVLHFTFYSNESDVYSIQIHFNKCIIYYNNIKCVHSKVEYTVIQHSCH